MTRSATNLTRLCGVLLALVLLGAACGGGAEVAGPTDENGAEVETDGEDTFAQLSSFSEDWQETEAKITYAFESTSGDQTMEGTFTLYWKPPDGFRMDYDFGADAGQGIMISSGAQTYVCQAAQASCFEFPSQQGAPAFPFSGFFTDPDGLQAEISARAAGVDLDVSTRQLAGVTVRCYSVRGSGEGDFGEAEWCFTEDGLFVRFAGSTTGEGGGTFAMTATEIEASVADDVLDPPYEVQQFPGAGN